MAPTVLARGLLALVLCLPSAGAQAGEAFYPKEWGRFGAAWSMKGKKIEVDVTRVVRTDEPARSTAFWVFRKTASGMTAGQTTAIVWADSRRCPQLLAALNRLSSLDRPVFASPRLLASTKTRRVMDGGAYFIEGEGIYPTRHASGTVRLTSSLDAPVALWIETTLGALRQCWTRKRPY